MVELLIWLTWYDGPGPNTACMVPFDEGAYSVAAPPGMGLDCGDLVVLSHGGRSVLVVVNDRMPQASADAYGGLVLDVTPAVMDVLGIEYGRTSEGVVYGRGRAGFSMADAGFDGAGPDHLLSGVWAGGLRPE